MNRFYDWLYWRLFGKGLAYRGRNWWAIADWLKGKAQ